MAREIAATILTEDLSDFHYILFYDTKSDLSFYSDYSRTTRGYERFFEVGKGSDCFIENRIAYLGADKFRKWAYARFLLTKQDIKALEKFLDGNERKTISVIEKERDPELNKLVDLDEKILKSRDKWPVPNNYMGINAAHRMKYEEKNNKK